MKNIVIGAAFNYTPEKIRPFVESLRKVYDDKVVFLVKGIDEITRDFYKKFQIDLFEIDDEIKFDYINVIRFEFFHRYFTKFDLETYEKILICDTRDIIFQTNPFDNTDLSNLYFYAEPELIGACETNSYWYRKLYGEIGLSSVKDKLIICGGTILGKRKSVINFIEILWAEIIRLVECGKAFGTCDQAVINYIAHNVISDRIIGRTYHSNVATLHHAKTFMFNSMGQLLNTSGVPVPIIHQYDRHAITQRLVISP